MARYMKTKIVYAITSDNSDIYLDQLVFSVKTLRRHNPNAKICVIMDCVTENHLVGEREKILSLIDEKIVIKTPDGFNKRARSRYVKTLIRQVVVGPYLFIDTDTIITANLSPIDSLSHDVAACLDRHLPLNKNQMGGSIVSQLKIVGLIPNQEDEQYFNSGVMFVNDTRLAHNLYERWHSHWYKSHQKGMYIDQPALALANKELTDDTLADDGIEMVFAKNGITTPNSITDESKDKRDIKENNI